MKKSYRNVVLGLIFALCFAFMFFGFSFTAVEVKANTGEVVETAPEDKVTVPEGVFTYEEDEEGVIEFSFISEKQVHIKMISLNGNVEEDDLDYVYYPEKNYYVVGEGTDSETLFQLDLENKKVIEYTPTDEEIQNNIKDTAKEISIEVERLIMIIAGVLSALGVSGATIATFFKWINKKLMKNNEDLKDSKQVLAEAKEMFVEAIAKFDNAEHVLEKAQEALDTVASMIKEYHEQDKARAEEIHKAASEILVEEPVQEENGDE